MMDLEPLAPFRDTRAETALKQSFPPDTNLVAGMIGRISFVISTDGEGTSRFSLEAHAGDMINAAHVRAFCRRIGIAPPEAPTRIRQGRGIFWETNHVQK